MRMMTAGVGYLLSGMYSYSTSHEYHMNRKVVLEEDSEDGGFIVSCPAVAGCHSEGETVEEALEKIKMLYRDASR